MKDAEAAFVATGQVQTILSNVHGIPSKAQREELAGIAAKLEMEKLELAETLEEQKRKHATELEQVRKEAESKAKELYEAQQQIDTQRHLAGDLIKTLGDGKDDKEVDTVLASMGPEAMKFFAARGRDFIAASSNVGAPVDVVETEVQRIMRTYAAAKKKKGGALLTTEERKPDQDADEEKDQQHSTNMQQQQQYNYRNMLPSGVMPQQQPPVLVQASSRGGAAAPFGEPIRFRQRDNAGRIVAASSANGRDDAYLPESQAEYDPGQGPNFKHHFMLNQAQIDVYREAPTHEATGSKFNLVQAGYQTKFIDNHRRAYNHNADANKRKALSDMQRMQAEQRRALTALPMY